PGERLLYRPSRLAIDWISSSVSGARRLAQTAWSAVGKLTRVPGRSKFATARAGGCAPPRAA
ncbi:MAG: hypothetical protein WCF44_02345, partial [Candidatus Methylophosphatis roskildensis]